MLIGQLKVCSCFTDHHGSALQKETLAGLINGRGEAERKSTRNGGIVESRMSMRGYSKGLEIVITMPLSYIFAM